MRMKRFSSAICLTDNKSQTQLGKQKRQKQQQQQVPIIVRDTSASSKPTTTQTHKFQPNQSSKQMSGERKKANKSQARHQTRAGNSCGSSTRKSSKETSQGLLLSPEDPIILARQRRPSASNQGSVNVDQQGKFVSPVWLGK